jgi:hypothetical protein
MFSLHGRLDAMVECEWIGYLIQHWQHGVIGSQYCLGPSLFTKPLHKHLHFKMCTQVMGDPS